MRTNQKFYLVWLVLGILQIFSPNGSVNSILSAEAEEPSLAALRVSRDFFQRNLQADVRVAGGSGDNEVEETSGPVSWEESELPAEPADPSAGPVLASFPDSNGCASFSGGQICFKMMGDVSNLGLNDRELKFQPELVNEKDGPYHITSARRSKDQVVVLFQSGSSSVEVTLTAVE
jgi:hypothetical protein